MKRLFKRIKLWIYWRRKHSTEGFLYDLSVLFGIQAPFSFRVMAPLELFIDERNV